MGKTNIVPFRTKKPFWDRYREKFGNPPVLGEEAMLFVIEEMGKRYLAAPPNPESRYRAISHFLDDSPPELGFVGTVVDMCKPGDAGGD